MNYKLTEQESRALATAIANAYHQVTRQEDFDQWIIKYMKTYNRVMNAIDKYNQSQS